MGKATITGKKRYTDGKSMKFFIPGDEPAGWVLGCTEAYRKSKAQSTSNKWQDNDYREKQLVARSSDDFKEKSRQAFIKMWANDRESVIEKQKQAKKAYFSTSEAHNLRSAQQLRKWQEADYREKQSKLIRDSHKDLYDKHPEYLVNISKGNKETWKNNKADILSKQYTTKTLNNSFNSSTPEDEYFEYLLETYGNDNVLRQHSIDERYPFNCDFYIPSEDLFIEYQGTWTHGGHLFDLNSIEDQEKLKQWKIKAENSSYYANAITVWTVSDPLKYQTALKNNLNIKFIY